MQNQASNHSEIPATVGRYKIIRRLADGGMATVYLAYDPELERDVAVKVIRQHIADDPHYITRFFREIAVIKELGHSAIVPIYDASRLGTKGEERSRPYLVMQFLRGGTLLEKIQAGPLPETEIVRIIDRIAAALGAAHKNEIVHRDLKPGNILFNEHGEAYLTDFGIAKVLGGESRSQTQGPIGTPAYMSPEQMHGLPVDSRTDIYALGMILFEMLTGQRAHTLLMARHDDMLPSVSKYNPAIREPLAYDEIISKALANSPDGRFQTASDMAQLVAAAAQSWAAYYSAANTTGHSIPPTAPTAPRLDTAPHLPPASTAPHIPQSTTQPGRSPRNWTFAAAGVGLLLFVAIILWRLGLAWNPALPTIPAEPPPTNQPVATDTSTPTVLAVELQLPASPEPGIIMVLDRAASAVWQLDDDLSRIPADGRLPVPPNQPVLIQSSSEPIQMVLPDRTRLLLDLNTQVNITLPQTEATASHLSLAQGRLMVETAETHFTISTPLSAITLPPGSSAGFFFPPDGSSLLVDCLAAECPIVSEISQTAANLVVGESAHIAADGHIYPTPSADYGRYVALANAVLSVITPTPLAATTPLATPTSTTSPTAVPTPFILSFVQNRMEIGRSINGVPIEAIQLSQGSRPVLFVGGIHAGYAPNALALVEAIVVHFQAHPEEIPADIALYVIPNLNPDSPEMPGVIDGRFNAHGVDLNRNWDCRWQANTNILGEFISNSGGTAPVSEPESQALQALIQAIDPQAVIFWGSGGRGTGLASPGACEEISLVSAPLAQAYGRAADFNFVDGPIVLADTSLNGDVTNWLDKIGIPAAFIILPHFQGYNWEQNYAGVQAVFDLMVTGELTAVPLEPATILTTPTTCTISPADPWATSYAAYHARLGCALHAATTPAAAYQQFANGLMIWRQDKEQVYILYQDGSLSTHTVNDPALANFYLSDLFKGSFGYLWQNNTAVRTRLGQPQAPEQVATNFAIQDFTQGVLLSFADIGNHTYLLLFPETIWLYP
jgi:serine/threonine protein kinase